MSAIKPKMGRPTKPKGERWTAQVGTTLTPAQKEAVSRVAADRGHSASSWLRALLLAALDDAGEGAG